MTLLFMDGLDNYTANANLRTGNRWDATSGSAWGSNFGVRGGGGFTSEVAAINICNLGSSHNILGVGFWWKFSATPSGVRNVVRFNKSATATTSCQASIGLNTSRQLTVYKDHLTTLVATGATVLTANTWYFIEVKLDLQTVGAYTVKINDTSELSGSGDLQAEATTGADYVIFGSTVSNILQTFDDVYILNTSGSAPQNDLLGPIYIDTLAPNGDNTVVSTPSTGSDSYAMVDETNPDSDTTYAAIPSSGTDLYNVSNLNNVSPTASVYAVQATMTVRQDEITPALQARNKIKSGSTTSNGTTRNLTESYVWWSDFLELNPDTAAAWSTTTVDAVIVGVERI